MAMIKCPECGKEISSKATVCPNCGCPSSEFANIPDENMDTTSVKNSNESLITIKRVQTGICDIEELYVNLDDKLLGTIEENDTISTIVPCGSHVLRSYCNGKSTSNQIVIEPNQEYSFTFSVDSNGTSVEEVGVEDDAFNKEQNEIEGKDNIKATEKKSSSKKKTIIISVILVIIGLVAAFFGIKKVQERKEQEAAAAAAAAAEEQRIAEANALKERVNEYGAKWIEAYSLISEAAPEAATEGELFLNVWNNSVWKKTDANTDKYTRQNGGSGAFYSDFNDAITQFQLSEEHVAKMASIQYNQEQITILMRQLTNPPTSDIKTMYDMLKDLYDAYMVMTNKVLYPTGSLLTYSKDFQQSELDYIEAMQVMNVF